MLTLGSLAFAAPWLLLALVVLPLLWWLLRVTPPSPRVIRFPAIRLLFRLREKEDTPAHTPWWLLLLRLAVAGLLIVGLAHPLLNPGADFRNSGPLVLVIDNGWSAGSGWERRQAIANDLLDRAARQDRQVILLNTARPASNAPIEPSRLIRAAEAKTILQAATPVPWRVDHEAAREAVDRIEIEGGANVVFLSDGLQHEGTRGLVERLQRFGGVTMLSDEPGQLPMLLRAPGEAGGTLTVQVDRPEGSRPNAVWLRALAENGRVLSREKAEFAAGERTANAVFRLPTELRNRISRIEVERHRSAGATVLLDERNRRRPVGIVDVAALTSAQPLLSDIYYLERALAPYTEVRKGPAERLLRRPLSVIFWPDAVPVSERHRAQLRDWISEGGVLVRFAGPNLADSDDELVPVRLRRGNRSFGGAMSWTEPATLAAFDDASPFRGLRVPEDVTVRRQVLAEPTVGLNEKTWARLSDGTPLVTAERRGQGVLVLMHTTANPDWSNLPLSGLFVQMLRRTVALSQGVVSDADSQRMLPASLVMDGLGRLGPAPESALPIQANRIAEITVGPSHPPGFYGEHAARRALNLSGSIEEIRALNDLPNGVQRSAFNEAREIDLRPWILSFVLMLFLIDLALSFILRGLVTRRALATTGAVMMFVVAVFPQPSGAQQTDQRVSEEYAIRATRETVLAYLLTGNEETDRVSEAALRGLGRVLTARTSIEPGDPIGVNAESDPLALFPVIYWPITQGQAPPSTRGAANLESYLQSGGMLIFDIRARIDGGEGTFDMRQLVEGIDIPSLRLVPDDHVITRSYYLLQRFPGRWADGRVWVARENQSAPDGVSPVIIGSNDWAAAWAVDRFSRPMFPVVPGGEYQREMAYRVGINLVMYALTGNYKGDQVHLPTIMRRLGQ